VADETDPNTERWRNAVEAEMRLRGYSDHEIERASRVPPHVAECEYDWPSALPGVRAPVGQAYEAGRVHARVGLRRPGDRPEGRLQLRAGPRGHQPGEVTVSLHLVPVSFADACGFVKMWHRHHQPPVGHKFSIGVADDEAVLRGVAIIGRPVARMYDDGLTLEVVRTATDGTANVNSMLYAASWRSAKALGYRRLVSYTQDGESGASLRAAGWRVIAERPARKGWDVPSRPREDRGVDGIPRTLWEAS